MTKGKGVYFVIIVDLQSHQSFFDQGVRYNTAPQISNNRTVDHTLPGYEVF